MAMRLASRCFRTPMVLACKRSSPTSSKFVTTCSVQNVEHNGLYKKTSVASYVTSSRDGKNDNTVSSSEDGTDEDDVNLLHDIGAEMNVESILMKNHIAYDFEIEGLDEQQFPSESPFEVDDMLLQDLQASVETLINVDTEEVFVQDTQEHNDGVEMNIESIMMNSSAIENGEEKSKTIAENNDTESVDPGCEINVDSLMMDSALADGESEDYEGDDDYPQTDDEIRSQILSVALDNVPLFGWTTKSIEKAVEELELSPSSSDLFKRGALDLVLFFIEEGNNALVEHIAAEAKKSNLNNEDARNES